MKAIEFVGKFGLEHAIEAVKNMPKDWEYCCLRIPDFEFQKRVSCIADCVDMDDLKQIVEAFDLVETYGGLQRSKDHLNHRREYGLYQLPNLQQAVNLVEQCNAKS